MGIEKKVEGAEMNLVDRFNDGTLDIEEELLRLDGSDKKDLDMLLDECREYAKKEKGDGMTDGWRAKLYFDFLWKKEERARSDNSSLGLAAKIQADPKGEYVGNCVGLTALYSMLLKREGIDLVINHLFKKEGSLYHVNNSFVKGDERLMIENTHPQGFGMELDNYTGKELPLKYLLPLTLTNIAKDKAMKNDFFGSMKCLNDSIEMYPEMAQAYFNRSLLHQYNQDIDAAIRDLDKAIGLNPDYGSAIQARKELAE